MNLIYSTNHIPVLVEVAYILFRDSGILSWVTPATPSMSLQGECSWGKWEGGSNLYPRTLSVASRSICAIAHGKQQPAMQKVQQRFSFRCSLDASDARYAVSVITLSKLEVKSSRNIRHNALGIAELTSPVRSARQACATPPHQHARQQVPGLGFDAEQHSQIPEVQLGL